ncbi:MAG: 1-deoxy-D-xylulose-5-phosphate synthase [Planctomycetota bacterium]|nr:MAG: 1-deoxy-D-xylulose-5-phosphate synthase [Planctomycetota bacterium]
MKFKQLDKIQSPADLKKLNREELVELAEDIRNRITSVINKGHLATNLGVTEITIAIHYVFDFLKDKVIFDVGHNVYPHKLITGRNKDFESIRKKDGLSGYPNRNESPYDLFNTAHASASISTMLGIRAGFDIDKNNSKTVAIIGDGSMPGGMSMEALNQAGHLGKNILIILNDNEMAISPTVGAVTNSLNRCRSTGFYHKSHSALSSISRASPDWMGKSVHKVIDSLKNMIVPGQLFTELGIRYRGPIDGHDIDLLIKTLEDLKDLGGPILLHVLTKKGKGLDKAQADPLKYHDGFPSKTPSTSLKYQDVFAEELINIANKHPEVVALTAAMATGTGLVKFQAVHPDRCFDVGIAEQHGVGFAAGLAETKKIPFIAIYSTFLQRALDQIFQEWALQEVLHGVFCLDRSGLVGSDGATHGGVFDIAYLRSFPGMILMAPKDGEELRRLMWFATNNKGLYAIRYPRGEEAIIESTDNSPIQLGKGELLQAGEKIAFLVYGAMNTEAAIAAKILEKEIGIKPTIFNMRFAKPVDHQIIKDAFDHHDVLITLEDHQLIGGFGTAVAESMLEQNLDTRKLHRIGIPDKFIAHAERSEQFIMAGLDGSSIAKTVSKIIDSPILT